MPKVKEGTNRSHKHAKQPAQRKPSNTTHRRLGVARLHGVRELHITTLSAICLSRRVFSCGPHPPARHATPRNHTQPEHTHFTFGSFGSNPPGAAPPLAPPAAGMPGTPAPPRPPLPGKFMALFLVSSCLFGWEGAVSANRSRARDRVSLGMGREGAFVALSSRGGVAGGTQDGCQCGWAEGGLSATRAPAKSCLSAEGRFLPIATA